MLDFWDCVNVAIDYTKQTLSPRSKFPNKRLKSLLMKSELKQELLDELCSYFKSSSEFYISWEEFVELYECSMDAVELINNDDNLDDILLFLEEIGLLFPVVEASNTRKDRTLCNFFPLRFFLGWDKHTIEIVQDTFLRHINRNVEKFNKIDDCEEIDKSKTIFIEKENLNKKAKNVVEDLINEESIKKISKDTGISVNKIYQMGRERKYEYNNLVSENVGLYFIVMELKRRAPLCKHIKKDGSRCQNNIRHPSGYCHHHR